MRLLEALNYSKLIVPSNIAKMETEMKKEYAAAERKAKAQYKASQLPAKKSEPLAAGKKRKQPEPSGNINNINVNISLGNNFQQLLVGLSTTDGQSSAKKAKAGPSKPTNKTTQPKIKQPLAEAQKVQKRPRQTAKSAVIKSPMKPSSRFSLAEGDLPNPYSKNIGSTKKKPPVGKEPIIKKNPRIKQELKVEGNTQTNKKLGVGKESKVKKETRIKNESGAQPPSKIKDEIDADPPRSTNLPSLGLISGIYDLSCPTVEGEWSCADLTLTLSLEGTTVWGAYDLGMFSGIIFLPERPWQASNEPLPFTWRGRENGEGEMSFGNNCQGEMYFLGNGNIEGWINVYGQCSFTGVRRPEAGTAVMPARSMRVEWEGYDERAYEEESRSRWK